MQEIDGAIPGTFSKRDWKTDACVGYVQYNIQVIQFVSKLHPPSWRSRLQPPCFRVTFSLTHHPKKGTNSHRGRTFRAFPTSKTRSFSNFSSHSLNCASQPQFFNPPTTIPTTTAKKKKKCFETKVKPLGSYKWCYNINSMCSNEQFSGVNW